jgi:hypothetical protein
MNVGMESTFTSVIQAEVCVSGSVYIYSMYFLSVKPTLKENWNVNDL